MIQCCFLNEVMESETISNKEASSKSLISRDSFFNKHKSIFVLILICTVGLAFWLAVAYFDEGYNRFPTVMVDYIFVLIYALIFPIIPSLTVFIMIYSAQKNKMNKNASR